MLNLPAPTFDLASWIANYSGPLLPLRLAHIATNCPPLSHSALSSALAITKTGKDVALYARLTNLASALGFTDLAAKDSDWMPRREDANRRESARLEQELKGYKNNLIRESIRMGQEDLALHLLATGGPPAPAASEGDGLTANTTQHGLNAAYAAFGKMRDFCTMPQHTSAMTLRLQLTSAVQAITAIQTGGQGTSHFTNLASTSNRLRSLGNKEEDQLPLNAISHAGAGIAYMATNAYSSAAESFLQCNHEALTTGLPSSFHSSFTSAIATANDVAIYGGLCSLATLPRADLQTRVLDSPFRKFLELEPHIRKAITLFATAKYAACLATLQRYYADWSLDVFLAGHVDNLFSRIREKSIVAHFQSFSQLTLASLAQTFPPAASQTIESEVLTLIENGSLTARLDLVNGKLVSPSKATRKAVHGDAREAADEIERSLLLRLGRVNVLLAGLEIPSAEKAGAWAGGVY